jgi:hypothetical protein
VGKGLAHAPVGEAGILQVEAEIRVGARGIAVLPERLAEGGVLGLPRVLDGGQRGQVHPLGLELEKDRPLVRDHAVDHAPQIRAALVVLVVRDEHDLLAALPLLKSVRSRSDRPAVLRRFLELAVRDVLLEQVLGQHPHGPALHGLGQGALVPDAERVGIDDLGALDSQEVLLVGRRRLRIDHRLIGEQHVLGRERVTVVPLDIPLQLPRQLEAVRAELPRLRHGADVVQILVGLDEAVVDHIAHFVRCAVARDIGNEPGDVADGGLDERVAVGRSAGSYR